MSERGTEHTPEYRIGMAKVIMAGLLADATDIIWRQMAEQWLAREDTIRSEGETNE